MASLPIDARRRAEKCHRLTLGDPPAKLANTLGLGVHFLEVTAAVLVPTDRGTVLAVEVGVQLAAGAKFFPPGIPGFIFLGQAARPIAANEQPKPVAGFAGVVPAFGLDG